MATKQLCHLGTQWMPPAEGSTVAQLNALLDDPARVAPGHTRQEFDAARNRLATMLPETRMNLEAVDGELTVLQPYDLRRIAECS